MTPESQKGWLCQEESRIKKYQHQHRGLSFIKFLLPPHTDRKVNLVGRDNHIYRGSIRRVREDQLPPEIREETIDEEALYKEIMDMNFPPVSEQEPLGPPRRIGGKYTLAKGLTLAPVQVDCTEGLKETLILGSDGIIYRGKERYPSKIDEKLRQAKRPIQKVAKARPTQEYVEPSLVLLQAYEHPTLYGKCRKSLIELPKREVGHIISLMKDGVKRKSEIITTVNETPEHEQKDVMSEEDKASEEPKKTMMQDETNTGEQTKTDTDLLSETDTEASETEESSATGEEKGTAEESDTESPSETDVKEESEEEKSPSTEGAKETAERSDSDA